jgi:photosystem II stability/assembly factor-like uncharacterized protein
MHFGRFLTRSPALFCIFLLAGSVQTSFAAMQNSFDILNENAILVRNAVHAVLIGIATAGKRLVAVGEHGVIIYSDDNGQSWRQAIVPVGVTITTVAFATPEVGWAAGAYGVILHTNDGGAVWTKQLTGIQVNQLTLAAAEKFMRSNPTAPASQMALRRANIFMAAGPDKPFLTIIANDSQHTTVFGAYRMCDKTVDGGKDWIDCSLNIEDPLSHNLYDAAEVSKFIYLVGEIGKIFYSQDHGTTFQEIASPGKNTLFGILDVGNNGLLTFGVAGGMFRSIDGGKNWASIDIKGRSDLTAGIILKSGVILVVNEAGSVYASTDDGESFKMLPVTEGMSIFDLQQAPNGDIVLVGSAGARVTSEDMILSALHTNVKAGQVQ